MSKWLPIHWQLDLYVLRRFVFLYLGNLLCFTLVYVLIDLFENLDEFDEQSEGVAQLFTTALRYYSAVIPSVFCQLIGPVVALTAGLFTVTIFHRSNELVPMLANGRPFWRIVMPVLCAGFVISLGTFLVQELWIPSTASTLKEVLGKKEGQEILRNQTYHDTEQNSLIEIREYHVVDQHAKGVTVLSLPRSGDSRSESAQFLIFADSMEWTEPELESRGYWLLRNAHIQKYANEGDRLALVPPDYSGPVSIARPLYRFFAERELATSLIPEDIEAQKEDVVYMRLEDLERKMSNIVDRRWAVKYYGRFASPFGALVLLLVGLPVIGYFGSRNVFFGALIAALIACAFLVSSSASSNMALRGFLPVSLGAGLPPLAFSALGIAFLRYLRA